EGHAGARRLLTARDTIGGDLDPWGCCTDAIIVANADAHLGVVRERRAQLEHADLVARLGARGAEANPRPRVDLVFPGDVGVSHAGGILLGAAAQRLSPAVEDAVIDHVRGAGVRIPPGAVG